MNARDFYDAHTNFSLRTLREYEISPGIKCKFEIITENLELTKAYNHGIDLGCSGNSYLWYMQSVRNKLFLDISSKPLTQYSLKKENSKKAKELSEHFHPVCGDICHLPYADGSFDIVCSLDTLEHIKNDSLAIAEIARVLKQNGICIITVPHRKDLWSLQDQLIGHYRRYEIHEIIKLFRDNCLEYQRCFNVYGKLMRFAWLQTLNPMRTERNLINLRLKYDANLFFRKFWKAVVRLIGKMMKIDAKYHKLRKGMNVGFVFIKR